MPPLAHPAESTCLKCEEKLECTRKRSGSEHSGQKAADGLLDSRHRETPRPGKSHAHEMQDVSRCLGREPPNSISGGGEFAELPGDPDTRPLDPSSSSTDPNPKRSKTTFVTDNENLEEPDECGGQDEDGDLRPILHESCENAR